MNIQTTALHGVVIIEPNVFGDSRGFFFETWNRRRYAEAGLDVDFVQDNLSFSQRGTLRGLHFQNPHGQGKLVSVLQGEVYDVAVDIRPGSPTFGRWVGVTLSAENSRQVYVPPGFAHGFCVTSEAALFAYKCTDYYAPQAEATIAWDDPDLAIRWPIRKPILSAKDERGSRLRDVAVERLSLRESLHV
ncbi:MAG: dTDP-4-dehydrorhamnose 3,5-epimerase [Planctomycetaceae bacterium]